MNEEHTAFNFHFRSSERAGAVTCLVISPKGPDGVLDSTKALDRDIGRGKALEMAAHLLAACDAPEALLEQVRRLRGETAQP
jgi:hypothetical protein